MKSYLKILKSNKLIYSVLLISITLSMSLMTIIFSNAINQYELVSQKNKTFLNNNAVVQVIQGNIKGHGMLYDNMTTSFKNSYITIDLLKSSEDLGYKDITAISGNLNLGNLPNVYKGKFLDEKDTEKQILLGKNILYKNRKINVGNEVNLFSENFIVTGLLGNVDKASPFDNSIYILYRDMPEEAFKGLENINYNVTSNDNLTNEISTFQRKLLETDNNSKVLYENVKYKNYSFISLIMLNKEALKIWGVCMVNCIIMGYFAVFPRKKEISLLRIHGATTFNIIKKFFNEYLLLTILSGILSFIIQSLLKGFLDIFMGYTIELNTLGFVYGLASSFITVCIVTFATVFNSLRVKPIINIKG